MTATTKPSTSVPELRSDTPPRVERLVGIGVAWKLAGQIAVNVTRLLTVAVLARFLTPADYGVAAIAVVLASFAPTLADMGIGAALVQAEAAPRLTRSTAFWTSVGVGVTLFVIFAVAARPAAEILDEPQVAGMVVAGGLTFAIYSVGSTNQAVFMREMRFRTIQLRTWLALAAASVVAIIAAIGGAGPWALVSQQLVLTLVFAGALWWRPGWRPTFDFSRPVFRDLSAFAIRIAGGRWARLIELLVLSLLIGRLASVPDLGAWTFAMSTVILPLSLIAIPTGEVMFSGFSRLQNEPERMRGLWLDGIAYLAAAMLPAMLGLMIVSPDLIPAAFGLRWEVSVGVVQILSVYVLIRGLQSWGSVYMDAVGRPEVTFWTQLASLFLTPIAVVIGVNWGIEGVAICYVISQMIAVEIPMCIIVLSQMRLSPRVLGRRLSGIVAASFVMAVVCWIGRQALEVVGIGMAGRAAITIALGVLVYAAALRLLAPEIVRSVVQPLRSRLGAMRARRRPALQP